MARTDHCPICDVAVKPENLLRHVRGTHPRHPDTPGLLEKMKRDPSRARSVPRPKVRLRRWHVVVASVIVLLAVGAYYLVPLLGSSSNIVSHCSPEATAQHYHPLLVINVGGSQQAIQAEIGIAPGATNPRYQCPAGQIHVLHTHDGSGIIHVEMPVSITQTPTLGDFFSIWGQPLSTSGVWTFSGSVSAETYDMGSRQSQDHSANPGGILLYAPTGGNDPFAIPQNLIFNGAYGTGQSNGFFSGEIIYLNVTAA